MTKLRVFIIAIVVGIVSGVLWNIPVAYSAEECGCPADQDPSACTAAKISCFQSKISETQQKGNTLSNLISVLNGQLVVQELQIKQTKAQIDQLEKEINSLGDRITGLNISLDRLTNVLIQRVLANYKNRDTNVIAVFLSSESFSTFLTRYKYLQIAQHHTSQLMQKAEAQKTSFDEQKTLKEQKQAEVEKKRVLLQQQEQQLTKRKQEQQVLLQQTKNDEARYQAELAKTLAEQQSIQSIVAGGGNEVQVRDVHQGDTIASIISGSSTCSNGTHLHFEVVKDGGHQNPASYLKPISVIWNNQPDDSFGFGGDWEWPLNDPARVNQGYGMTWYARVRRAYGGAPHTGIDIISKTAGDSTVKAVKDGVLYRGTIKCGGGQLRYVKVKHKDSDLSTYYLHINY